MIRASHQSVVLRSLAAVVCLTLFSLFSANSYALIGVLSEPILDPNLHASNSDLVNAGAATLASVSSTPFALISEINDGTGSLGLISEQDNQYPATIVFNLDISEHSLGYSLSHLVTISGVGDSVSPDWPDPSETADQLYDVAYSLVGDPAFVDFASVASVSAGTHQKVTLVSLAGDVPSGVDAVRFTWFDPLPTLGMEFLDEETYTAIVEIDVFGAPVSLIPEPTSVWLLLASLFHVTCARRTAR